MNKHITMLSALLLLQLVVAGILFSADSDFQRITAKSILQLSDNELAAIEITDVDTTLKLTRKNGRWQLDDYPELPLQTGKLFSLSQTLADTEVTWPVTTTASSHGRFKVGSDNFEKQVTYIDINGHSQSLLLGSSPSFKLLYARNSQSDQVYIIDYNSYQLATTANDWLDKSLLAVENISRISHADINLFKQDDNWQLTAPSALSEGKTLDNKRIESFISQLTGITVSDIVEGSYQAAATLVVQDLQQNNYTYSFASNKEHYLVKRDDYPYWFSLPKARFEQLSKVSLEQFVIDESKSEESTTADLSE